MRLSHNLILMINSETLIILISGLSCSLIVFKFYFGPDFRFSGPFMFYTCFANKIGSAFTIFRFFAFFRVVLILALV